MYAVIETAGKQYRVELGTQLEIDRMDVQAGQTIQLDRVLLVVDGDTTEIGRPTVAGAVVAAAVVRQDRGEKIVVFKYGPKTRRRVKQGHRQDLTLLRLSDISWGDRSAAADAEARQAEEKRAAEEAAKEAAARAASDRAVAAKLAKAAEPATPVGTPAKGDTSTKAPGKAAAKPDAKASDKAVKPTAKTSDKTAGKATAKPAEKPARKPASRTQAPAPEPKTPRRSTKKDE